MLKFIKRHLLFFAGLSFLIWLPCGISLISFGAAVTPEEALAEYQTPLPKGWSAGVWSGGRDNYYRWWPISERPVLFGCSLIGLILSGVTIYYAAYVAIRHDIRKRAKLN